MITFSVLSDSAVKLTFDGNSHYLQDGEITVPKNSLALVKDESELITFIKAATGDAYLSFHIEDTNFANYTELENWYKANMVSAYGGGGGGGGVTSGEVQTMIDNSISGKAETSAVTSAVTELNAALSGKADTYYVNTALADKADTSAVTVSIEEAVSGKADESYVETALADKVDVSELEEVELAVAQSISVLAQSVSGKQDTLVYYYENTENNEGMIETSVEDGGVTKTSDVIVTSNMDGDSYVELSALEHSDDYDKSAVFYGTQDGIEISYNSADNVEGTSINHTIYVNADGFRIETNSDDGESTNTTEFSVTPDGVTINGDEIVTESDLTASLSGKQDTLVAGSGITISGNVISADGGGGGGMSEDDELLLATALVDLNDRKMDITDARAEFAKYQRKGDYVTSGQLDTRLADYETALDEQNVEEVTSYALNDLNERLTTVETALGGLSLSAITQSQWATISGSANPSTIYIITNNE